jgi:hypothetical protein
MPQFYLERGKDYYDLVRDNPKYKTKVDNFFVTRGDFHSIDEIRKTAKMLKLDEIEFDIPKEVTRSVSLQDFEGGTSKLEMLTSWPVNCYFAEGMVTKEIAVIKRIDL